MNDEPTNSTHTDASDHAAPVADLTASVQGSKQTSAADFRSCRKEASRRSTDYAWKVATHCVSARPSVNNLVKTGQLPFELANAAIKIQSGWKSQRPTTLKNMSNTTNALSNYPIVSPKIVEEPRDGEG